MTRIVGISSEKSIASETGSHSPYVFRHRMSEIDDHIDNRYIHLPAITDPVETDGELLISNGDGTRRWVPRVTVVPLLSPSALTIWAAMPAAVTEFLGIAIHRIRFHMATYANVRLSAHVAVAGSAGSELRLQWSADGAAWAYLNAAASAPALGIDSTGDRLGAWVAIDAVARGEKYYRLVGYNGNGATSPSFGTVTLQLK